MATQPIGYSNFNDTQALLQKAKDGTSSEESTTIQKKQTQGGTWKTQIREQIEYYLKDVPKGEDGKLSFQDVDDYRKKLEKEWDDTVKADLAKLGVNTDEEFPLSYDATKGKLTVKEGHPDKVAIDKYFADNPDKVKEFTTIIQLGKMTSASRNQLSPVELQKSIQQQAISWWYEDNSDPSTWFKGGGMMLGQSQASYTGLNLKV